MLRQADAWLTSHVMTPALLNFAKATRQSVFACSRLFWFLAGLVGMYRSPNLIVLCVFSAFTAWMLYSASLRADMRTRSHLEFRLLGLSILALFLVRGVAAGVWAGTEFWLLVTLAQYSSVIPDPRGTR